MYSTVLDVARLSGIYSQILNEAVGTGDGSATAFTLDESNVVKDSETVYVAGVAKTQGTDYNINNEAGTITFLLPPAQGAAITANYKYFPDSVDITNDDVEEVIQDADAEIEEWTGKKWTDANAYTEYFEGRSEKQTTAQAGEESQYSTETWDERYVLLLTKYPVQGVSKIEFLDDDGTVDDTLTEANEDYHWWSNGKIQLIGNSIPVGKGKKKVKVTYTYGASSVPRNIKNLSAAIAGIIIFVNLTGGSFDEITSYTLGPKSVSVGEPYMNMREAINKLEQMRDRILNQIGRDFRTVVI